MKCCSEYSIWDPPNACINRIRIQTQSTYLSEYTMKRRDWSAAVTGSKLTQRRRLQFQNGLAEGHATCLPTHSMSALRSPSTALVCDCRQPTVSCYIHPPPFCQTSDRPSLSHPLERSFQCLPLTHSSLRGHDCQVTQKGHAPTENNIY